MNTNLKSPSKEEWQRQKHLDGARNEFIDSIMDMIGLEDVKEQILRIKAKVDVNVRQGTDVKNERFNISLLGNPGTGLSILEYESWGLRSLIQCKEKQPLLAYTPNS